MAGTASMNTPQDVNQNFAIIGVQGTLGTADTKGTSVTMPLSADPTTGALYVNDLSGGGAASGTNVNVITGTIDIDATSITHGDNTSNSRYGFVTAGNKIYQPVYPYVFNAGGSWDRVPGNSTVGAFNFTTGGTIGVVQAGTINSATVVLNTGTISVLPNLPQGSINVTAGTIATLGTMGTLGLVNTITTVSNITNGSVNVTAGTIATLGTMGTLGLVNTVTTVSNLTNGSIKVTAGTEIITSGSINVIAGTEIITSGSINVIAGTMNAGTLNIGTIVGNTGTGVVFASNPVVIGGTLAAGGTVYSALVDTSGRFQTVQQVGTVTAGSIVVTGGTILAGTLTNLVSGTINSATAVINSATISVLPNLPQGSINVTAGTITAGTLTNLVSGTINSATAVINSATISVLPNLPQGSINVTAGTVRLDARTTQNIVTYGTQIAQAGAFTGTIIGSASVGAGTSLWMDSVSIINPFGTAMCVLGFGTAQQGTNVLFRGSLGTQSAAGIQKQWMKATNAGMTNQDLVFSLVTAGTVDLTISYFISA